MVHVHVGLGDVHRAVLAVAEGFLGQFLAARAMHNLECRGGLTVCVPGPDERTNRNHTDHGVLTVLSELADRTSQGAGQTHGAGCLQQHDSLGLPTVLGVELDGMLNDRLGCGGIFSQVCRTHERYLGTVLAGDISQLSIVGGDDNTQLVLAGDFFLSSQCLLDSPCNQRLTRDRTQVLTRNALRATAHGNDAENTHYASKVSIISSAIRCAGSFFG